MSEFSDLSRNLEIYVRKQRKCFPCSPNGVCWIAHYVTEFIWKCWPSGVHYVSWTEEEHVAKRIRALIFIQAGALVEGHWFISLVQLGDKKTHEPIIGWATVWKRHQHCWKPVKHFTGNQLSLELSMICDPVKPALMLQAAEGNRAQIFYRGGTTNQRPGWIFPLAADQPLD